MCFQPAQRKKERKRTRHDEDSTEGGRGVAAVGFLRGEGEDEALGEVAEGFREDPQGLGAAEGVEEEALEVAGEDLEAKAEGAAGGVGQERHLDGGDFFLDGLEGLPARLVADGRFVVDVPQVPRGLFPAPQLRVLARLLLERELPLRVRDEGAHRGREGLGIAGRCQNAVLAVVDDGRNAAGARRDDRQPGGHGFDDDEA
mmetsp:Transcript_27585/g.84638  ORF Transcript_27585/g.84638 Transcript_27585/m.84638 type:complete len:201 (+) Transcript_27585:203-805(+)